MRVLGIETSCDETALAIVDAQDRVLSSVISSQADLQAHFGGVVPEVACRRHAEVLLPLLDQCLDEASLTLDDLDVIAVTQGPGLMGALLVGLHAAKGLSLALGRPLIGVNHVEAHLAASIMGRLDTVRWPMIGVVISGGHTVLVEMEELGSYRLVGTTVDDAIGEAFDKVAVQLELGYPGGPAIEKIAQQGDPSRFPLRAGRVKEKPLHFSFSGLKTAVLYQAAPLRTASSSLPWTVQADLAASFQEAALGDIVQKTLQAVDTVGAHGVIFGGGVACNQRLRQMFMQAAPTLDCFWPGPGLSTDNAAMIAWLGGHYYRKHRTASPFDLEPYPNLPWTDA